jgi:hypothetical protein
MKGFISYLMLMAVMLVGFSCSNDDEPSSADARINFYMVDAPANYDEVWIEVESIKVNVDKKGEDSGHDSDEAGWVEIPYEANSKYVNLLDLTGANSLLLGTEDFPEGKINQIRLMLGDDNYVVMDGKRSELTTPSAEQSGLKIKVNQVIEGGMFYDLIIDFDAAKSIVSAGASGKLILKPVLRAYLEEASGISGQVLPVAAQVIKLTATRSGEEVNTFTDVTGNYKIQGLADGTYSLTFTPNELYSPKTVAAVVVVKGKITTVPPVTLTLK